MSPLWRLWLLLGSALCLAHAPEKDHNRSGDEADEHQEHQEHQAEVGEESRSPSGSSSTQTCDPDHDSSATSSNDPCACSPGGTGRTSAGSAGGTGGPAHVPGRGRASSRTPPGTPSRTLSRTLSGTPSRTPSPWGRETEATSSNHPFGSSAARSGRPAQSGRPQMGRSSRNTSPSTNMWQQSCSSAACSGGQMNNIPGGVGMSGVSGPYPLFWCIQQPWQLPPDVRVRVGFQNGQEGVPRVAPLDSPPPSEEQARREQWARERRIHKQSYTCQQHGVHCDVFFELESVCLHFLRAGRSQETHLRGACSNNNCKNWHGPPDQRTQADLEAWVRQALSSFLQRLAQQLQQAAFVLVPAVALPMMPVMHYVAVTAPFQPQPEEEATVETHLQGDGQITQGDQGVQAQQEDQTVEGVVAGPPPASADGREADPEGTPADGGQKTH